MVYYIDPSNGSDVDRADGLSPEAAIQDYTVLRLQPGDSVLFKRGSFIRGSLMRTAGTPDAPILYGAYGEGENPIFCRSVDLSNPDGWMEIRPQIWQYIRPLPAEVCNFILDKGHSPATLRWSEASLCQQGDWFDSRMGRGVGKYPDDFVGCEEKLLFYSQGNPGQVYNRVECTTREVDCCISTNVDCTICQDLCFYGSGVNGITGGASYMTVRRCTFCFIGGCVWDRRREIRYGNAIEFWNRANHILIEDCCFFNVYDSCITHQGSQECQPAEDFVMRRNLFLYYGMAAYESRDRVGSGMVFADNLCLLAGDGFSAIGASIPRQSEIYPQPMGHHLFLWRISMPEENSSFQVTGNRFYKAVGAAIYSIISPEAEKQVQLQDNLYVTDNSTLLNRWGGINYPASAFDSYCAASGETGTVWQPTCIEKEAADWFTQTGCSRYGVLWP